jgi:hypothetical protein
MAFGTVVVRGGNDSYESYTNGEFYAVSYVYNHITPGETLGLVAANLPFGYRDVSLIKLFVAEGNKTAPRTVRPASFVNHHVAWVILSQSQEAWGVNVAGYPVTWEASLESSLLSEGYKITKAWPTATVLRAPKSITG